jgi:hypothetical protein
MPTGVGVAADDDVAVQLFSDAACAVATRQGGRHYFDEMASAIVFLESPEIRAGWVRWCLEADDRIQLQAVTTVLEQFPEYAGRAGVESQPHWRTLIKEFEVAQRRRDASDPDLVVDAFGVFRTGLKGVVEAVTADGAHHLVTALSLSSAKSPESRFCRDLNRCSVVPPPPGYIWARIGQQRRTEAPIEAECADVAAAAIDDAVAKRPIPGSDDARGHELVHVAHRGLLDALELLLGPNNDALANADDPTVRITVQPISAAAGATSAATSARVRLAARGRSLPAGDARLVGLRSGSEAVAADVGVSARALRSALAGGTAHVLHFRDDGQLRIEALSAERRCSTIAAVNIAGKGGEEHRPPRDQELVHAIADDAAGSAVEHEGIARA